MRAVRAAPHDGRTGSPPSVGMRRSPPDIGIGISTVMLSRQYWLGKRGIYRHW